MSFTSHKDALLLTHSGNTVSCAIETHAGGVTGGDPPAWIGVAEPSECIEFRPSERLRQSICDELGVPRASELGDINLRPDPVLLAASMRVRADAAGSWPLDQLEADALIEALLRRLVLRCFGGQLPRATTLVLDDRKVTRVMDYIESNLSADLSLDDLAQVAALSRYHFIRAFKATTGLTPHRFLLSRRMNKAARLFMQTDLPLNRIARQVGYTNGHDFRRIFAQHFGCPPSDIRKGRVRKDL
jgi:AraC family transcriptional regulator